MKGAVKDIGLTKERQADLVVSRRFHDKNCLAGGRQAPPCGLQSQVSFSLSKSGKGTLCWSLNKTRMIVTLSELCELCENKLRGNCL